MSRNGYAGLCGGTTLLELRCENYVVGTDVVGTTLLELRCWNYVVGTALLELRCYFTEGLITQ
jgi:hypothetical protein